MSVQAVNEFNSKVRTLLVRMVRELPGDAKIERLQRKAMVAIDMLPTAPIKLIGPHLLRYQKDIYSTTDYKRFFTMKDPFHEEIQQATKTAGDAQAVLEVIPRLQEVARGMTNAAQHEVLEIVQDMLQCYVDFVESEQR